MLTEETNFESEVSRQAVQYDPSSPPTPWQENHGNLLVLFVGLVFLFGAGILLYRQNRFVPVRFPESDMIAAPVASELPEQDWSKRSTIKVTGAANDLGAIMIAIYDSESKFNRPAEAVLSSSVPIVAGEAVWEIAINQLPVKMAVAAFHDENNDQDLNRNHLGIPTERYGFSRNARGMTGPPNYKQAVIDRPKAGETIELFIR